MNILVITDSYFFSGSQNIIANMIKCETLNQEHRLEFIIPRSRTYVQQFKKRLSGRHVHYTRVLMPACSHLAQSFSNQRGFSFLKKLVYSGARLLQGIYLFLLYDVIRTLIILGKSRPDLVYINNSGYPASDFCRASAICSSLMSVDFILHINNIAVSSNDTRWFKKPFEKYIDRIISKHANRFILGSKFAANKLHENRHFPKEKILNIYNTYTDRESVLSRRDLRRKKLISEKALVFGIVGVFEPRKGHKVFIDAICKIGDILRNTDVVFLVEGRVDEAKELMDYANRKKAPESLVFTGEFDNIFDFYHMIDVLVLPSLQNEDFPNVIIEAMSVGVPCVGSRIAGIPESIRNGHNGCLVEPGDSEELSGVLREIIVNQKVVDLMKINCLKDFEEKFRYEIIMNKYLELFKQLDRGKI